MARSEKNLTAVFTDTANAIRSKTGTTETICPLDFADKINAIQTGGGTGGGMKAYFEAGGKCPYSNATSFDGIINYSDTENVTDFTQMFFKCSKLTKIPNIDMHNCTISEYCFSGCSSVNTPVDINAGNSSSMKHMFSMCINLPSAKITNTNQTDRVPCNNMLASCHALKTVTLNSPRASDFEDIFHGSYSIVSANLGELHKQTGQTISGNYDGYDIRYNYAFSGLPDLEEATLDIGSVYGFNVVNLSYAFYHPESSEDRTTPLVIHFLNGDADVNRNFKYCFAENYDIKSLPAVNCAKATGLDTAFSLCEGLLEIKFYNISTNINLSSCNKMSREALVEVLNNLATVTSTKTCTLGATNLAKLTDEDKAIATNKGWTLA